MSRVVVTGADGFIGSAVCEALLRVGKSPCRVVRRGRETTAQDDTTFRFQWDSPSRLARWLERIRPDAIIHAAGSASVAGSLSNPELDYNANVGTVSVLLEGVRQSEVDSRVVLVGSAAVYGNPDTIPVSESAVCSPLSAYGYHKLQAELLAQEYSAVFGISVTVARLFSVLGPEQRRLLPYEVWWQAQFSHEVVLQGSGTETRDYLYIDDAASVIAHLAVRDVAPKFEILNVASGVEDSVGDLARAICELVAPGKPIVCRGRHFEGDPLFWRADIRNLLLAVPNWRPRSLPESIRQCIDVWSREEPDCSERVVPVPEGRLRGWTPGRRE